MTIDKTCKAHLAENGFPFARASDAEHRFRPQSRSTAGRPSAIHLIGAEPLALETARGPFPATVLTGRRKSVPEPSLWYKETLRQTQGIYLILSEIRHLKRRKRTLRQAQGIFQKPLHAERLCHAPYYDLIFFSPCHQSLESVFSNSANSFLADSVFKALEIFSSQSRAWARPCSRCSLAMAAISR